MKEILVYLSIIHNGNWNAIYKDISEKKPINKNEVDELLKKTGSKFITLLDNDYPQSLKSIFKPPFVLFYEGNKDLLKTEYRKIGVIGSRENSEYGEKVTKDICKDLVKENFVIVSGLAKGIDCIAHSSCINTSGNTIAVLGNGLNVCYPKENSKLYDEIRKKGLLISEYPPNTMPNKNNFPSRNRIISGLCEGIVIVEAKEKSGTMNTVSHALEDGKQIFCVPERIYCGSGCNKLIKEGAKLIESAKDIIDEL